MADAIGNGNDLDFDSDSDSRADAKGKNWEKGNRKDFLSTVELKVIR